MEYIRTLFAKECYQIFQNYDEFRRGLFHYGKFILDLFPNCQMEAFGGLKVFQKQYEQLLEYEEVMRVTGVSEFEEWDSAKFHK